MKKKDLYKLKPGAILEILWLDAPPEVAILLEKPEQRKGDVSLKLFYPKAGTVHSHATHEQVFAHLRTIELPAPTLPESTRFVVPKLKTKQLKRVKITGKKLAATAKAMKKVAKKNDAVKPASDKPIDPKLLCQSAK